MKYALLLTVLTCIAFYSIAQPGRFEKELIAFKQKDSISFPKKGQILFSGSSSIRLWDDFETRYQQYAVFRRGVGGCCLYDMPAYAPRIIFPYKPSKLFIYAGENDIASGIKADSVFRTFKSFYTLLNDSLPATLFYYISVKPSPSRAKFAAESEKLNRLIAAFINNSRHKHWTFIDVYHPMLGNDGKAIPSLFKKDNLHMLSSGYDIWDNELKKYM